MESQSLTVLRDILLKTQRICSWTLAEDDQLLYCNSPEQAFFIKLFTLGSCNSTIRERFSQSGMPVLVADSIGFIWIAVQRRPDDSQPNTLIYLLGPVTISDVTEPHLRQRLRKLRATPDFEERMFRMVREVPIVLGTIASSYAVMLHYCVNNEAIRQEDVTLWNEPTTEQEEIGWGDPRWHGTWIGEQRFYKSVMEGRYDGLRELQVGRVGNIGGGDPLRQAKNEVIVLSVLCSRSAIMGGVSAEGALNLEDHYIQRIEAAATVPEVQQIAAAMHSAFIDRVRIAKAHEEHSPLVRACMEYVETHIYERIRVKDIADEVVYAENYISRRFRAETGITLFEYINQRKIEAAKTNLKGSTISIAQLSDRLSFSNPSYFCAVFKKHTGLTPVEYQRSQRSGKSSLSEITQLS